MKAQLQIIALLLSLSFAAYGQTQFDDYNKAVNEVKANIEPLGLKLHHDKKRNILIDPNKVIHVFIFEDGNPVVVGYPTTATEREKIIVHMIVSTGNTDTYLLNVTGNFEPSLNVVNNAGAGAALAPPAPRAAINVKMLTFAEVGPFTGTVTFDLKRKPVGEEFTALSTNSVKIARTIHASIGSAFVYSTLKNPTNINPAKAPNGDSTLIADGSKGNATLTIMATLYPTFRNSLMMPSKKFKDHYGIVVGTTIASTAKNFKNLYLGLQYDFAVGGSFVGGIDIAERQKIYGVDYNDFTFGESKFTGKISNKLYKQVGVGVFFGVQVDSRIFAKLFTAGQ